jgi:peptide deformylase
MINPKVIYQEGEISFCEGCLSVPEYSAEVIRHKKIKVEYQDENGLLKTLGAEGLLSVAIQHEMDHLEGRLFIDRLSAAKKDFVKKKLLKS